MKVIQMVTEVMMMVIQCTLDNQVSQSKEGVNSQPKVD